MSAQVFLMQVRPATESRSANTFVKLVPNAPSFDKGGTLLAAECWLLLEAAKCRGKLRVLRSGDRRVVLLRETYGVWTQG